MVTYFYGLKIRNLPGHLILDVIPGTTQVFIRKGQELTCDTVNSACKQQPRATWTQSHKPHLQCVHVPKETKQKGGSEEIRQEADRLVRNGEEWTNREF